MRNNRKRNVVSCEDDWDSATISDRSFLLRCIALSTIPTFYIIYIIVNVMQGILLSVHILYNIQQKDNL